MKQSKLSRLSRWLVVSVLLLVAAPSRFSSVSATSWPDEMTHEEAATLVKSHEMFSAPQSATQAVTLHTGMIHARPSDIEHYQPHYTALKSMGLIELDSVMIESPDKDPNKRTEHTRVSLTEKGLAESKDWKQVRENEWRITIATRELVKVIEIHKDGEGRIHGIEFSWTWAPSKIAEALKFTYAIERAYAKLERQENEWRIVKIHAL